MQQLQQWKQWSAHAAKIPAPLRSAVLHAWLTHVHPWLDGNGQTARAVCKLSWSSGNTVAFPPWIADADHSPFAVELTTATGHGDQWFARLPDHSIRACSTSDLDRGIAESLLSAAKQN